MDTYFRNRVALYCAVTAAVTVAVVAAFDVTLVERAKRGTGVRIDEVAFERQTPPKPLQMADAHARSEVRRRYDELVARRSSMLSEDERYELLRLLVRLGVWQNMYWLGIPVLKSPEDMWMMQQIIAEVRPDYIVEAGTWNGGSALYFAHVLEGLRLVDSKVITIDVQNFASEASKHPLWQQRVEFVLGSSTHPQIVQRIAERVRGKRVIVVLDSDHSKDHVLKELEAYAALVSAGSYIVVEDTILDSMSATDREHLRIPWRLGPMAAVREFLNSRTNTGFQSDFSREAFVVTLHPGGWLRKAD